MACRNEMRIQYFAVSLLFALLSAWPVSTYPHFQPSPSFERGPFTPAGLSPRASTNAISCFPVRTGRRPPTVDTCRPTLNYLKTFPSYRLVQVFEEDKSPKVPSTPPFAFHHTGSDCVIRIATSDAQVTDRFSWAQIRSLATEIVQDCSDRGAYGGWAPIGKGKEWTVAVLGLAGANVRENVTADVEDLALYSNTAVS